MAELLCPYQDQIQRLAEVPGLGVDSAQQILAEVGPRITLRPVGGIPVQPEDDAPDDEGRRIRSHVQVPCRQRRQVERLTVHQGADVQVRIRIDQGENLRPLARLLLRLG